MPTQLLALEWPGQSPDLNPDELYEVTCGKKHLEELSQGRSGQHLRARSRYSYLRIARVKVSSEFFLYCEQHFWITGPLIKSASHYRLTESEWGGSFSVPVGQRRNSQCGSTSKPMRHHLRFPPDVDGCCRLFLCCRRPASWKGPAGGSGVTKPSVNLW